MFITLFKIPLPSFLYFLGDGLPVFSFGFLILLCFVGSYALLANYLETSGLSRKLAEDMVTFAGIGGITGARLFSVLSNPRSFFHDPIGTVFSSAGFVFYGGLIGGMLAVYLLLRKEKLSFYRLSDLVAPTLALGYAIGRIGCQLSGDGDYGIPTNLPWAVMYKYGVVPTGSFVHPTPVYESLFSVIILLLLTSNFMQKILPKQGQLFGFYLILSGIVRFSIEFLRIEDRYYFDLSQAQLISIPLILIGILMVVLPSRNKTSFQNAYKLSNEEPI